MCSPNNSPSRIATALRGVRGLGPCDMEALTAVLVNLSQLIHEHEWIAELDINPLLISETELVALDARVLLHKNAEDKVKGAIRSYPQEYEKVVKAGDKDVQIRPVRPEDEPLLSAFFDGLPASVIEEAQDEVCYAILLFFVPLLPFSVFSDPFSPPTSTFAFAMLPRPRWRLSRLVACSSVTTTTKSPLSLRSRARSLQWAVLLAFSPSRPLVGVFHDILYCEVKLVIFVYIFPQ